VPTRFTGDDRHVGDVPEVEVEQGRGRSGDQPQRLLDRVLWLEGVGALEHQPGVGEIEGSGDLLRGHPSVELFRADSDFTGIDDHGGTTFSTGPVEDPSMNVAPRVGSGGLEVTFWTVRT